MSWIHRRSGGHGVAIGLALITAIGLAFVATPPASAATATVTGSASGKAGGGITISGTGWPAYSTVNIYPVASSSTYICQTSADSAGTVHSTVCAVPTYLPYGVYTTHADDGTGQIANATQTFTLNPSVGLTNPFSSQSTVRAAAGEPLTITGHGFPASTSVTSVQVGGVTVATTPAAPVTDTNGTVSGVAFSIPSGQAAGTTPVAMTVGGHSGSVNVRVFRPTISAPASMRAGYPFTVSGSGWPVNETVNAYLVSSTGSAQYFCQLTTSDTGVISYEGCTAPTYEPTGAYTLTLSDGAVTQGQPFTMLSTVALTNPFSSQVSTGVEAGGQLTMGGHAFKASAPLTAVTVAGATVATTPAAPTTDSNGTFSGVTFTVPSTAAAGSTLIAASDGTHSGSMHVTVYRATMSAPTSGRAAQPIRLSGTGWPHFDTINVYLASSTSTQYFCQVTSDDVGTVGSQACTVPYWAAAGADHLVFSDGQVVVQAPFTVTSSITVADALSNQPTGIVAQGQTLLIGGHGFTAASTISQIKIGSTTVLPMTPATPTTDGNGTFSGVQVTIPTTYTPGAAAITVTDAASHSAVIQVQVVHATVTSPASAPASTSMVVGGAGWPAADSLNLYLDAGGTRTYFCQVTTDDTGAVVPHSCTIPYYLPYGSYTLEMTDQSVTVSKAFTVTPWFATYNASNQLIGGAPAGTVVTIAGHGFTAASAIKVKLGSTVLATSPAAPTTDTNGTFSGVTFTVPSVAKATYTLTVTDGALHSSTAQFTVQ